MKASISRFSHRPGARFSNTGQVQGGMITDADLTEAGQLHQARDEALGGMALASGVPGTGGMVALAGGVPSLRAGRVVAGGRAGEFALTAAAATIPAVMAAQADLPQAPALPGGAVLLYADLWDRVVGAHEDPRLTDAGLHGAVTAFRTRTMVQVKALPLAGPLTEAAAMTLWRAGAFPFLARGTAQATVAPNEAIQQGEDCDPCATSVNLAQVIPNALFRAEVLEVRRTATGLPEALRLAWSMENAETLIPEAALTDPTARDAFERAGAAYEWLNPATEAHQGVLAGAQRPVVTGDLTLPAAMVPAPTHVRRWDGSAEAVLGTAGAVAVTGGGALRVVGGDLELTVDLLRLTIATNGRQVQAGDHWLVELRRHAPEAERLHLVGGGLPVGPDHRFCPLFVTTGNAPAPLDDATRRRLSFPALNDLPADHIAFAPECAPLFGAAKNVQEALRALCSLNAGHVAYDPNCPGWYGAGVSTVQEALDSLCNLPAEKIAFTPGQDCTRFQGATNVAEALGRLCEPDDSALLRLVLKTMMDWGVVCGLKASVAGGKVTVHAGVALDREGRIAEVPETVLDLNDGSVIGSDRIGELIDFKGEVCLALDLSQKGKPVFHLTEPGNFHNIETGAFDPPFETTMGKAIQNCQLSKKFLWDGATLTTITKEKSDLLRQVNATWANYETLAGHTALTAGQAAEVDGIVAGLTADYRALYSAEEADIVETDLKRIDAEIVTTGLTGRAADIRRMDRAVAKIAVLERNEALSVALCECRNAHTPCPDTTKGSLVVPLGCLTFEDTRPGRVQVAKVCLFCCRKQSLHWRSWRYYEQPDFVRNGWEGLPQKCCEDRKAPDGPDWGAILPPWREKIPIKPTFPTIPPEKLLVWPPRGGIELPDDRVTLPDVFRLPDEEAGRILKGHGVDVVKTIDLAAGGSLDELAILQEEEAVKLDYGQTPRPGDRVVLLVEGGKTIGTVAIGKGDAPLPFGPRAKVADLGALRDELASFDALRTDAVKGMADLQRERTAVMEDVASLKAEVAALAAERRSIGSEVLLMRDDQTRLIAEIASARDGLKAEIDMAKGQLQAVRTESQALIFDMGGRRGIDTLVTGNAVPVAVVDGLKAVGVNTLAEAEGLSDAQLRRVIGRENLTVPQLRDMVRNLRIR